jgi:hypothetical protein
VTLMAVNYQQLVAAHHSLLCMLVKVLQPLQTKLICCPAVLRDCDNSVPRQILLIVLDREVMAALEDDEG